MMTEEKKMKIEFAPGCFDNFDGTQEELDELVKEIKDLFENKSREEIEAQSKEISDEDWEELPDEAKEQIFRSIMEDEDDNVTPTRRLQ